MNYNPPEITLEHIEGLENRLNDPEHYASELLEDNDFCNEIDSLTYDADKKHYVVVYRPDKPHCVRTIYLEMKLFEHNPRHIEDISFSKYQYGNN